jgi:xanthine dehydrogenase YagR molybdenum-binding subunit
MDRNWPDDPKYLGRATTRVDGPLKVTGRAKYTTDVQIPGLLYGMILRSPWPSARLAAVDLAPALQVPGIRAALLVQDVPRTLHYYGDEIAAVAGTSREACREALSRIRLDATPAPFVVDERQALNPDAPRVLPGGPNVGKPAAEQQGDVDAAFAGAAAVVEGTFSTQVALHHALEPHGNTAAFDGDELTVWASTQGLFAVRDGLADHLGMPQSKVRVRSDFMGGGFGAKLNPGVESVVAARLAQAAGAPVRLILSRFEEALAVGNRPSTYQKIRLGADRDGTLVAFDFTGFGTGGYPGSDSESAMIPAPYIYRVPSTRVRQYGVAVNAGAARPMRAPGHPQASFGMEAAMDELAVKLGMDPVALRLRNTPHEIHRTEFALAAERFGWKDRYRPPGSSPGIVKTGVGCAAAIWWGGGQGTRAEVQVNPDGTVEVRCGTQDLGTGTRTLIAVVAAELLGLSPGAITVRLGDTRFPPSGMSGGSMTAASVSPAVYDACEKALADLKAASGRSEVQGDAWKAACRTLGTTPLVVQGQWREGLSSAGVGGVQMAAVEVDTGTGVVRVTDVVCVQDCGLVVNKLTAESQVNGGILMGLGYALFEQRWMDDTSGVVLNPNLETYKLPGPADVPRIRIYLLNQPERGVIGLGEPVTIPTAAAIANAVANALGVRIPSLPLTPEKVLAALGKVPNAQPDAIAWDQLARSAGV